MSTHDCVIERCDTDTRHPTFVEAEGYAAGLAGLSYAECPYGHTHPDVRFGPWQRGRSKALGEWCYSHRQPLDWCAGIPDMDMEPAEGPCDSQGSAA